MPESDIQKRDRLRDEVGSKAAVLGDRDRTLKSLRGELASKEAGLNGLRGQIKAAEQARSLDADELFGLLQQLFIAEEKIARGPIDISPEPGAPEGPPGAP